MTTFNDTITLSDPEYFLLREIVPKHKERCEHFLEQGAPRWAQRESCKSLLTKLEDAWKSKDQMSGYFRGEEQ